ncbi:hypothetical protein OE88DRAFT_1636328 [Heliocybe sulcata]|uniref:DNA breaking-rejoining enzyme n=1 Tax=Heliocybe sulcata TaxID=5364 RepID=A0A5C3N1N2_9AGAM|nr:hypothetical protein OE88DRAFT_1636328 [Heliocybe sulcata]
MDSDPEKTLTGGLSSRDPLRGFDGRIIKPCKPRNDNFLAPSPYRPLVAACDRLRCWYTPFSEERDHALSCSMGHAVTEKLLHTLLSSIDHSTRQEYGAGLLRFAQFCDDHNIDEQSRMPASEVLLAAFISEKAAGVLSDSAAQNWLQGLHFWHKINDAQWNGSQLLKQTLKGVRKLVPATSRRAKRPPVTIEHMWALWRALDLRNSLDAAVWACACTAFWGCCRLGELTVRTRYSYDASKHVRRDALMCWVSRNDGVRSLHFHLPWTKSTQWEGADISLTGRPDLDPLYAIRQYLHANSTVPSEAPLFSFEVAGGSWAPLVKDWFLTRCRSVWSQAGLQDVFGHSFRIGGTTELLLSGVAPEVVAAQGRWKSLTFMLYWRKIESILPLFISRSYSQTRIADAGLALEHFRIRNGITSSV